MNQTCKVCGEPAAGFHFGAFTCEGCKSFFGRSYNNLSSISECKNNGECVINKKNRTACKACRLRKCLIVGMSKSGSRYGRRSNWFKIHCLLQEQQQQQAAAHAAAAAAHNHSRDIHQHHNGNGGNVGVGGGGNNGNKKSTPPPPSTASALSMLGHHPGLYPHGLYPPRTKEDLMMLGLEDYSKHPSASPSVSSPDSHNSDSSVDINVRSNSLLRLSRGDSGGGGGGGGLLPHKDLFLPLPFPGLSSMPVMPPPAFLPPSHHHLLFPGYHPALYQHHQGLLRPAADLHHHQQQQQQQQHSLMSSPSSLISNSTNNNNNNNNSRYTPNHNNNSDKDCCGDERGGSPIHQHHNNNNSINNNNHLVNGSKAAEELTKRFYLDAVLKSQRYSPLATSTIIPSNTPTTTPTTATTTTPTNNNNNNNHMISHSIITPNSEISHRNSDGNSVKSIKSEMDDDNDSNEEEIDATGDNDSNCDEDLVVSMTPPRSPIINVDTNENGGSGGNIAGKRKTLTGQDNPIDLSMKTGSSSSSSNSSNGSNKSNSSRNSSKSSSCNGSIDDILNRGNNCNSDNNNTNTVDDNYVDGIKNNIKIDRQQQQSDSDDDNNEIIAGRKNHHQYKNGLITPVDVKILTNNNNNNSNINNNVVDGTVDYERDIKRMKLQTTTTPLDLTTKV